MAGAGCVILTAGTLPVVSRAHFLITAAAWSACVGSIAKLSWTVNLAGGLGEAWGVGTAGSDQCGEDAGGHFGAAADAGGSELFRPVGRERVTDNSAAVLGQDGWRNAGFCEE